MFSPLTPWLASAALISVVPPGRAGEVDFSVVHEYGAGSGAGGLGHYLTAGADVDADGFQGFLIRKADADYRDGYTPLLILFSGYDRHVLRTWEGWNSGFGRGSVLGDVDGDGYGDCLVANPQLIQIARMSVAVVQDTDGDGIRDIAVYESIGVHVFSGRDGTERLLIPQDEVHGNLWSSLPNVDGDGAGELLIGAPDLMVVSAKDGRVLTQILPDVKKFPYEALGLPDITGDGLPEVLATAEAWDFENNRVFLLGADSLRHSQTFSADGKPLPWIQLRIRAPAVAGHVALLLFCMARRALPWATAISRWPRGLGLPTR